MRLDLRSEWGQVNQSKRRTPPKRAPEESRQIREALARNDTPYRRFFEDGVLGMFRATPDGKLIAVNMAFARLFGYASPDDVKTAEGSPISGLFESESGSEMARKLIQDRVPDVFENWYRRKDSSLFFGRLYIWAVQDADGQVSELDGVIENITAQMQKEAQLRHAGTHDSLTGLYNRSYLEEAIARLEADRSLPISILLADVDHLKLVNDRNGHEAGDELLRRAARFLQNTFRVGDTVARIGGDEFAVLLLRVDDVIAPQIEERVRKGLVEENALHPELTLALSIGTATARPGESLMDTLNRADECMYQNKRSSTAAAGLLG